MRIECEVRAATPTNGQGVRQDGVEVECGDCGHCETAFGTGPKSVRRALIKLRDNCPEGETNFYVAADGEDDN